MLDGSYPDRGGYTVRSVTSTVDLTDFDDRSVYEQLATSQPERHADASVIDYYSPFLDDPDQRIHLDGILSQIRAKAKSTDDQARISISLVQHIPYDVASSSSVRYPYQVLCDNTGDCDEKSLLLAYLLRELGYGVALLCYEQENHMAVGIAAPPEYDCHDSGYAFVETTRPSIITDDGGDYANIGRLTSVPTIVPIAEGRSLAGIEEEYRDARELIDLRNSGRPPDAVLDSYHYARWQILEDKYGLNVRT